MPKSHPARRRSPGALFRAGFALAFVLSLGACGGGGGGGGSSDNSAAAGSGSGDTTSPPSSASGSNPPSSTSGSSNTLFAVIAPVPAAVVGTAVTLAGATNGTATTTWTWTLASRPAGSSATLSNAGTQRPTLVPDRPGSYVVTLVVADGGPSSDPVSTTIVAAAANAAPVADAGQPQSVAVGATVTLDGSRSSDPNGDRLTFAWSLPTRPAGSNATLAGAGTANPVFVPDVAGEYVARLVVGDGQVGSNEATVRITASVGAPPPVANAGLPQNVAVGATVTLDGSGSRDVGGAPLSYLWTLTSRPTGSTAQLADAATVRATFVADVAGSYSASLRVGNGRALSETVTTTVTATTPELLVPIVPTGMPAWAAAEWLALVRNPQHGTTTLQKYVFSLFDLQLQPPSGTTTANLDFAAATPGHKLLTLSPAADGSASDQIDVFAVPPTWQGDEKSGAICWTMPRPLKVLNQSYNPANPASQLFTEIRTHLCHDVGTYRWTWDAFFTDAPLFGYWSNEAPQTQQFQVLEAMRKGMNLSRLFSSDTKVLGVDRATVWTASKSVGSLPLPTDPAQRPFRSTSCAVWTFTPELYVTDGEQNNCDANDLSGRYVWKVASTTPMPAAAPIGARGAMGSGGVKFGLPSLNPSFPASEGVPIAWGWEMRRDTNSSISCNVASGCRVSSALLCAVRTVEAPSNSALAYLNATRCFRVTADAAVTGIQVPEFSTDVQPL